MTQGQKILSEVGTERVLQDRQWGGPDHDDHHTKNEWRWFIVKQMGEPTVSSEDFEHRMIKAAALAVAAVESSRRKRGIA